MAIQPEYWIESSNSTVQALSFDRAVLTVTSRNYGSWSLRGFLLCRFAGLDVEVRVLSPAEDAARAELLLLSPSFLVPRLDHGAVAVWDTLAIAEYLHELRPEAGLLPQDPSQRAHCRSICGEMHSGFANLRSALPMNLKARHPGFRVVSGAQADVDRITTIWRECLAAHGGPFLFGATATAADAMYAPVCARFATYDVDLDPACADYRDRVLALDAMVEWTDAARAEPDAIEELEIEF
jgi:glutathione S-transferase